MKSRLLFVPFIAFFCILNQPSICVAPSGSQFSSSQHVEVSLSGDRDVVLGALLPLHVREKQGGCGTRTNQEGLVWLDALNYAVEEVNIGWKWPFNVSLSLQVRDTCSNEQTALEQALDFANRYRKNDDPTSKNRAESLNNRDSIKPVLGVISGVQNKDASTLLALFKVPEVIFAKGAPAKHPKDVMHSISLSFYKARAVLDLIKHFAWSAVSVVYSEANYNDFKTFWRISSMERQCIAVVVRLTSENSSARYERVVEELSAEPQSTVVILFTKDSETIELNRVAKNRKGAPHFTWIVTDQQDLRCFNGTAVEDALILIPQYPFMEGFKNFYSRNTEQAAEHFLYEPTKVSNKGQLLKQENSLRIYEDLLSKKNTVKYGWPLKRTNRDIQAAMNSVFLLAHAYRTTLDTNSQDIDRAVFSRSLARVLAALYGKNWKRFSGQREMKQNMFSLIHLHKNGSSNSLLNVGTWDSAWYINQQGIKWRKGSPPQSSCGDECPPGHIRVLKEGCKCCWSCFSCHHKQIVHDVFTCADCLRGYWPSWDFKRCEFQWRKTLFDCALAVLAVVLVFSFMVL